MRWGILALLILPLSIGAASTLWVSHEFIGGPKCVASGPVNHYQAPGFEAEKAKLAKARIQVIREYFRDKVTCQACHTCPNYHREIFFEIAEKDLKNADTAGYRKATVSPSADELTEYEDAKKFKLKPDFSSSED